MHLNTYIFFLNLILKILEFINTFYRSIYIYDYY
jgi:hypothetical protein